MPLTESEEEIHHLWEIPLREEVPGKTCSEKRLIGSQGPIEKNY